MLAEEADATAPGLAERAQRVQAAAERCGRIVRSFLAMARQRETQRRQVTLREMVDATLQLLTYGLRASGIVVAQDIPDDLPMLICDPDQMQQVLMNLLVNARQALEERAPPRQIRIEAWADTDAMTIVVTDNGPGVAEAIAARIFDPFFTTKPVGVGTGIGLGVSRGVVEAHGGTLSLAARNGGGARFVVRLPLREASQSPTTTPKAVMRDAATRDRRSVLIVDDEAEVGRLLSEMLGAQAFRCDVVSDGDAAQALLERRDYDAILCDLRMPSVDGPAVFAWLTAHKPHLCTRVAFVTGDTLGAAASAFLARAGRPILEKPFVPSELWRLMTDLTASSAD
jgi:CheY-like chemotaxis protein